MDTPDLERRVYLLLIESGHFSYTPKRRWRRQHIASKPVYVVDVGCQLTEGLDVERKSLDIINDIEDRSSGWRPRRGIDPRLNTSSVERMGRHC